MTELKSRKKTCHFCGYTRTVYEDEGYWDDHICIEMDRQLYGIDF